MKAVKNDAGGWPTLSVVFLSDRMSSGAPSFGTESRTAVARDSVRPKGWDIKSACPFGVIGWAKKGPSRSARNLPPFATETQTRVAPAKKLGRKGWGTQYLLEGTEGGI